jgi:hypothetical protein
MFRLEGGLERVEQLELGVHIAFFGLNLCSFSC